jgi:hypothetical protein
MRSRFKFGTFLSLVITAAMASCSSDESAPATTCGNGVAEGDEPCDGVDLRNQTCGMYGPNATGQLLCNGCVLDLRNCGGGVGGQGGTGP